MTHTQHSPAALAEARQVVTRPDIFMRLFPDDALGLRKTAWDMLKEDHAARVAARSFPFHAATPGDAA